jgi:hypothetical protein
MVDKKIFWQTTRNFAYIYISNEVSLASDAV